MMIMKIDTDFANPATALRRIESDARMRDIFASFLTMADRRQPGDRRWYALVVMGGQEGAVAERLEKEDIHSWVPMRKKKAIRTKGRKKPSVDAPVIGGFVFVQVVPSPAAFAGLRGIKGVIWIVGAGETPMPISVKELESFRRLAKGGAFDRGGSHDPDALHVGAKVRVKDGPFSGFEGKVDQLGDGARKDAALIMLDLFGRPCPSWMPLALLERLG